MDEGLRLLGRGALRVAGMLAVVITLLLAWPGVRAVRADDAKASPVAAGASVQPADATPADASFEDFATWARSREQRVEVTEPAAGPTCSQAANALAPEIEHRRALAQLQARLIADMKARGMDGGGSDVVVLNGSGYNYRPSAPGIPAPPQADAPAR